MKISEKILMEYEQLRENGPITIVAFGDSVTHGALGYNEIDYETVYWNLLRKKILGVRDYVPVNVINAGIGGIDARYSIPRMDSQVLTHNPDLIIICFGLNDVNGKLDVYLSSLRTIFEKSLASGAETIFLSPNMMNTYVAEDTPPAHLDYAKVTAEMQNSGKMDTYINSAMALAKEMGVEVCDCYSIWKEMSKTQDTTMLLANRINHPVREMHELFANELFKIVFRDKPEIAGLSSNTMRSED